MRPLALLLLLCLAACASAPLYEAEARSDGRVVKLEVAEGGEGCPVVRLHAGQEDWERTGERTIGKTLSTVSEANDCDCAFDQTEPFDVAATFDLSDARAACEAAR